MLYVDSWAWVIFSHRQIPSEKSLQHHSWLHPLFFNPKIKKSIFSGQTSQVDHRFASLIFPKKKLGFIPAKCASPRAEAKVRFRERFVTQLIFFEFQNLMNYQCFWPSPTATTHHIFWKEFLLAQHGNQVLETTNLYTVRWLNQIVHIWPSLYRATVVFELDASKKKYVKKWGCFTNKNICKKMHGFWGYQEHMVRNSNVETNQSRKSVPMKTLHWVQFFFFLMTPSRTWMEMFDFSFSKNSALRPHHFFYLKLF